MNELNLNQAPVLDPTTEQLIHKIVSAVLKPTEKGECRCHWLDPTKTPILAWKSAKDPNTLVLKISTQKFIGLTRSDKNNEVYWKFRDFYEGGVESPTPTAKVPVTEKPKPKVDLPVVETPTAQVNSTEELEEVKKFREKFPNGNANSATQ